MAILIGHGLAGVIVLASARLLIAVAPRTGVAPARNADA
jgi:hypothetical protein